MVTAGQCGHVEMHGVHVTPSLGRLGGEEDILLAPEHLGAPPHVVGGQHERHVARELAAEHGHGPEQK